MPTLPQITEKMLTALRASLSNKIKAQRYRHTLGVEKEIMRLGELYLPQDIFRLRAAALLHDLTKEVSYTGQLALCEAHGITLTEKEQSSPKILHAITAPPVIQRDYPDYADPIILEAITTHTTGRANMPLFSKLLYLADYIEENRTFDDCVRLRHMFWDPIPGLPQNGLKEHLDRVLVASFDMTIAALIAEGGMIAPQTVEARNCLIAEINTHT